MKSKFYTVSQSSPGSYTVVDANTGSILNKFFLPGIIRNGPIVSNDQCSISTLSNNIVTNYIVKLPSGRVMKRYFV